MNKVILGGRLTADPELKFTPNGVAVATFRLAVNRRFKQEGQPDADFINCVVWQKPAENTANMVGKGCRVDVIGRWNVRSFDGQDGKKVYVNECIVEEITFIDFKDGAQGQNTAQNGQANQTQGQQPPNRSNGQNGAQNGQWRGNGPGAPIDISDDDLPF